jgi:hypothetical protein
VFRKNGLGWRGVERFFGRGLWEMGVKFRVNVVVCEVAVVVVVEDMIWYSV